MTPPFDSNCFLFAVKNDPTPRIDRIRAFEEFVETMKKSGRRLVSKLLSDQKDKYSDIVELPAAIEEVISQRQTWVPSGVRGGVHMALGLMKMHYPSAKPWRLGTGIPQAYSETERAEIFESFKGFASKIARMVSTTTFYPEEEILATPENPSDSDEDDDAEEADE